MENTLKYSDILPIEFKFLVVFISDPMLKGKRRFFFTFLAVLNFSYMSKVGPEPKPVIQVFPQFLLFQIKIYTLCLWSISHLNDCLVSLIRSLSLLASLFIFSSSTFLGRGHFIFHQVSPLFHRFLFCISPFRPHTALHIFLSIKLTHNSSRLCTPEPNRYGAVLEEKAEIAPAR